MIDRQARDSAKRRIHGQGKTIKQWAKENGFPEIPVYRFFDGTLKGRNGTGHQIAVALGLKQEGAGVA